MISLWSRSSLAKERVALQRCVSTGKRGPGEMPLKPDVPLPEIPAAFLHVGCWFLRAGVVYYFFGIEPREQSIAEIDRELAPA